MNASTAYLIVAISGLAVATFVTRSSFFVLPARFTLPPRVEQALRYAPACALAAIIFPGVLTKHGDVDITWGNHEMWAVIVAALVFAKTRNMLVMMAAGMAVFTALRLL